MLVEIDLGAIKRNIDRIGRKTGKPLILMVKADGYGHGALRVARAVPATCYGVATEREGIPLRELGKEVLVTAPSLSETMLVRRHDLIPFIGEWELLKQAAAFGVKRCHLKVDSGMNRLGFREKECYLAAKTLLLAGVRIEAIGTHYKGDVDEEVERQNDAFDRAVTAVRCAAAELGFSGEIPTHVTGSGALYAKRYDALRVGLAAYGYHAGYYTSGIPLEPAMKVSSEVLRAKTVKKGETLGYSGVFRADRQMKAYTVLGGYGDGIARSEVGRTVIAAGRRLRIAAVSMDSCEIVSDRVDLAVGTRVIILSKGVDAAAIASHRGTIPYEVLLGYDVPRAEKRYV